MINNITLVGRLTKDADLRYTSDGTATEIKEINERIAKLRSS